MLESIIALKEWTADSANPAANVKLLYIRTLQLPASLFQETLEEMREQGYDTNDRVHLWQRRLHDDKEGTKVLFLRYCGQTTGNPWTRHRGDMYAKLNTFFGRFLKVLGQTAEGIKVLANVKVHTVAGAFAHAAADTANLREQILIALFGDGTLNTQAGGKDVITLFREDRDNFDRLQTRTVHLLRSHTRQMSQAEAEEIETYAHSIYKYVGKNASTVGPSGNFTDTTKSMIAQQALPAVLVESGSAVMVTLGSDLGEEHESAEDTFWNAGGRSVDAVTRVYNFFCSWEGPTALESIDAYATTNLAASGHLPFVDLFPWFTKAEQDYPKASQLLRRYMNAAKPMIVLAYGERVSIHKSSITPHS